MGGAAAPVHLRIVLWARELWITGGAIRLFHLSL